MVKKKIPEGQLVGQYMSFGIMIGVVFGFVMGNVGLGVAFGLIIGLLMGTEVERRAKAAGKIRKMKRKEAAIRKKSVWVGIIFGFVFFVFLIATFIALNTIMDGRATGPVCGMVDVQCVTTPCDPVEESFSNRSEAKERGAYDIREGACVNDFLSCIAAGNPAMESYPRQCRDAVRDRTFVEVIEDAWRLDDIQLMRHEVDGSYNCFGCNVPSGGSAMCIDPIVEMKLVEESSERYCGGDFEVIEG